MILKPPPRGSKFGLRSLIPVEKLTTLNQLVSRKPYTYNIVYIPVYYALYTELYNVPYTVLFTLLNTALCTVLYTVI